MNDLLKGDGDDSLFDDGVAKLGVRPCGAGLASVRVWAAG